MTELQQTVSNWLKAAGAAANVDLGLDEDGHCNVVYAENLQCMVEVPEYGELFFFYTPLIQLPDDPKARCAILERALEFNMFSIATGGSTVSFDGRSDQVMLTFAQQVALVDEEFFKAALGDFLDLAIDLRAKVREEPGAEGADAGAQETGAVPFMLRV
jgi:hypothetical protein